MKREAVKTFRDGREICDRDTVAGNRIYQENVEAMRTRQNFFCCLYGHAPMCPGYLRKADATFEHQDGRGMNGSHRDDRIELPDGTWINGAAHAVCNNWKGSRRIDYNASLQAKRV